MPTPVGSADEESVASSTLGSPGRFSLERLRRRADFVAVARGKRSVMSGLILQARDRGESGATRIGFTCSKKVGNAVSRNRAKRRLRALAQEVLAPVSRPGWDYVLIGRRDTTIRLPFADLQKQLRDAIGLVHD